MNDISLCADFKRRTNIATKLNHLLLGQLFIADIGVESGEQFHSDIDIPANLIRLFHYLVVLNAYNVLNALQGFHQLDFTDKVIHDTLKIGSCGVHIQTFRTQRIHFGRIGRNRNHLDCRIAFHAVVSANSLVNYTEGSFTKRLSFDFPFRPYFFQYFNCHFYTSLLFV